MQPIRPRSVVELLVTFELYLQPQVLQVKFVRAFRLPQNFPMKIVRAFTLFVGSLLLLIPFQDQLTQQGFQ